MKTSLGPRTIIHPTPVLVVGTYDRTGKPNVMTAAWGGICCSTPPCVAVSLRKVTYTHGNVTERKAFTLNIPSETYIREADYFGMVSGRDVDKFSVTGLTPVKAEFVDAPYIREFPLILECALTHTIEIGLHTQFIGEVKDVKVDESVLTDKRVPDIEKIRPMLFTPESRMYYGIGQLLGKAFSIGKRG